MSVRGPYRGKRALDLAVALVAAVPASVIGAVCAVAIRIDDRGPIFFRQARVGWRGELFEVVKFRTMVVGESNPLFPDSARITRVGRLLRRFSLDELPQLLNVIRGEMSIVGPRPTLAYQVERYTAEQRQRLQVRPGLTGLAQVKGRNTISWSERITLDLEYLHKQSVGFDLYLLLLSVKVVIVADVGGHPTDDPIARPD